MVLTMHVLELDRDLASTKLQKLKDAIAIFVSNTQQTPLVYDEKWRGVVSTAIYINSDVNADFGNTLYNDVSPYCR